VLPAFVFNCLRVGVAPSLIQMGVAFAAALKLAIISNSPLVVVGVAVPNLTTLLLAAVNDVPVMSPTTRLIAVVTVSDVDDAAIARIFTP
jgi:hypothetical protein